MYMLGVVCSPLALPHVSFSLSYLFLPPLILHPSPPKPKNVANFWFFRCTYLVIFTCLWTTAVLLPWHDSATCSISELHTYIAVCPSQLLFRQMRCPKAIPTANWVLSSVQAPTYRFVVSMTFNHDFVHSVWSSNTILSSSSVSPLARMFPFPPLVRACIFFCWSYAYTMTLD